MASELDYYKSQAKKIVTQWYKEDIYKLLEQSNPELDLALYSLGVKDSTSLKASIATLKTNYDAQISSIDSATDIADLRSKWRIIATTSAIPVVRDGWLDAVPDKSLAVSP